jgi:N-acetylglutamate synthase-like GNAT family acetyltransferase
MADIPFHARRATLDDLPALRGLWETAMLPMQDLERHLTEFQIAEGLDGRLMGALGFQMVGKDARIYYEAYTHPDTEALVKPQLWNRLKVMAANGGVHRVWTQEKSQYWDECEFESASADDLERLPAPFKRAGGPWKMLALRDEAAERRIEEEIGMFQAAHEEDQSRLAWQTKLVKWSAAIVAAVFCSVLLYYTITLLANLPRFKQ